MNYLAHAFLSFEDPDVLVGNMISDFVKGKKQFDYPARITAGIQLHRAIDEFTDNHEATRTLKEFYRPQYRLYCGAFADVTYDYFLANDSTQFSSSDALMEFTQRTFRQLETKEQWFGPQFAAMFPYMKEYNWLYNYQFDHGIQKSFEGVRRRSAYIRETAIAFEIFQQHKSSMRASYDAFFSDVKIFAAGKLEQLLK